MKYNNFQPESQTARQVRNMNSGVTAFLLDGV